MQNPRETDDAIPDRDINDLFSDILFIEDNAVKQSYSEGFEIGRSEGNQDAFHLGYHRGAEIGAEIGFYSGIVDAYLVQRSPEAGKYPKDLNTLKQLLDSFPRYNDPEVDILDLFNQIRAKFKKVCAVLNIQVDFVEKNNLSF